jgi:Pectate lyase superfamily protein
MIINRILILTLSFLTANMAFASDAPTSSFVVNILDTGATGNGITDDTAAIQAAVNQVGETGGTVLVPAGTYMIDALASVNLKSNMTFNMESGAVLKAIPNSSGAYEILKIAYITNVNVVGGTIWGERHQHQSSGDLANQLPNPNGEWGYGILVNGSSNVYVEGVTSREMWGDGFCVCGDLNQNINFYGVVADDNRRQGLSIDNIDGMVVRDSTFSNTNNSWPGAGIDIEPQGGHQSANHVQILNSTFTANKSGVILEGYAGNNTINNITVTGNAFNHNPFVGLSWRNPGFGSTQSDNTFSGNTVDIGYD